MWSTTGYRRRVGGIRPRRFSARVGVCTSGAVVMSDPVTWGWPVPRTVLSWPVMMNRKWSPRSTAAADRRRPKATSMSSSSPRRSTSLVVRASSTRARTAVPPLRTHGASGRGTRGRGSGRSQTAEGVHHCWHLWLRLRFLPYRSRQPRARHRRGTRRRCCSSVSPTVRRRLDCCHAALQRKCLTQTRVLPEVELVRPEQLRHVDLRADRRDHLGDGTEATCCQKALAGGALGEFSGQGCLAQADDVQQVLDQSASVWLIVAAGERVEVGCEVGEVDDTSPRALSDDLRHVFGVMSGAQEVRDRALHCRHRQTLHDRAVLLEKVAPVDVDAAARGLLPLRESELVLVIEEVTELVQACSGSVGYHPGGDRVDQSQLSCVCRVQRQPRCPEAAWLALDPAH